MIEKYNHESRQKEDSNEVFYTVNCNAIILYNMNNGWHVITLDIGVDGQNGQNISDATRN